MNSKYSEVAGVYYDGLPPAQVPALICPFSLSPCSKTNQICSMGSGGAETTQVATLCPRRFEQNGVVDRAIRTIVNPFQSNRTIRSGSEVTLSYIGASERRTARLDYLYYLEATSQFEQSIMFGVELQSMYLSGKASDVFDSLPQQKPDPLSSIKRLMPQLELKLALLQQTCSLPKIITVVDQFLMDRLGRPQETATIADAEIIFLVVGFKPGTRANDIYVCDTIPTDRVHLRELLYGGAVLDHGKLAEQLRYCI